MLPSRCSTMLALGVATASLSSAQTVTWGQQFGTPREDQLQDMGTDAQGRIFTCGGTKGDLGGTNPNANRFDAWLASHDATGQLLWTAQLSTFENEQATGICGDDAGGAFVAGWTLGNLGATGFAALDAFVARYDASGQQVWLRQFGTDDFDACHGIAPDGQGGIFVSGYTRGALGGPPVGDTDAWLMRLDDAGNTLWSRQFGTSAFEEVDGISADGAGGVLIFGATGGDLGATPSGNGDAWVARIDGAGNQLWATQLGSVRFDFAQAAAPDGQGGAFFAGYGGLSLQQPAGAGNNNAFLARLDGTGQVIWIREPVQFGRDSIRGVQADAQGGVIVAGWSSSGGIGGANRGSSDAWIARYGPSGELTWAKQLGSTGADRAHGLSLTPSARMVVAGVTNGTLGGPNSGDFDPWIQLLETDLSVTRYCSPVPPHSADPGGRSGVMLVGGTSDASQNEVVLAATTLSFNTFGYFLTSRTQGFTANPGGSDGDLCLGGAIGRFVGPGQIQNTGAAYAIELSIDLAAMPQPTGLVTALPGESWNFQAWYRSTSPAGSDLTDAVTLTLR